MRRMSVLHQNSGGIGKSIPSALKISLEPRDFPRASPSGNLSGLGKSLGRRGWISQYLPRFGRARIQSSLAVNQKGTEDGLLDLKWGKNFWHETGKKTLGFLLQKSRFLGINMLYTGNCVLAMVIVTHMVPPLIADHNWGHFPLVGGHSQK